jgi:hypothetical protein
MTATEFQDRCLKPLGHPSLALKSLIVLDPAGTRKKPLWRPSASGFVYCGQDGRVNLCRDDGNQG